jgi:hypothetical protein
MSNLLSRSWYPDNFIENNFFLLNLIICQSNIEGWNRKQNLTRKIELNQLGLTCQTWVMRSI